MAHAHDPEMIMPLGKHKNKMIGEIPDNYLIWITDEDWFNQKYPNLSNHILLEIAWRNEMNDHIEG